MTNKSLHWALQLFAVLAGETDLNSIVHYIKSSVSALVVLLILSNELIILGLLFKFRLIVEIDNVHLSNYQSVADIVKILMSSPMYQAVTCTKTESIQVPSCPISAQ